MKKTLINSLIASFIAIFLMAGASYAQSPEPIVETKKPKTELLSVRKQKIETDVRNTINKLDLVITRTQSFIDLLNKNGKDTTEASEYLAQAKESLDEAISYIDQFSGTNTLPEIKKEAKATKIIDEKTASISQKENLKKIEESLRKSKTSIVLSIGALKTSIINND